MESNNKHTLGVINSIEFKTDKRYKVIDKKRVQNIEAYESVRENEQEIVGMNPIVIELTRSEVQQENSIEK